MLQFAYFTPNQITGSGRYLDLWNADLYWGASHLQRCAQLNHIQFRKDATTYKGNIKVFSTYPKNGVMQAIFEMPADDYFLGIVKLSNIGAATARVEIRVDTTPAGEYTIYGANVEIPVVAQLKQGEHWISVIQLGGTYWFHSITCFQV